MLKKRAQGLSVHTIILAVIGLIILVVIVLMLTGKLGNVGKGLDKPATCEGACSAIGMKRTGGHYSVDGCLDGISIRPIKNPVILPGDYSDTMTFEGEVCCCIKQWSKRSEYFT